MSQFSYVKSKYPGVLLLGVVSFFADIASEMLYPKTPIFLTAILGFSMANLGLIEGIAEDIASLLRVQGIDIGNLGNSRWHFSNSRKYFCRANLGQIWSNYGPAIQHYWQPYHSLHFIFSITGKNLRASWTYLLGRVMALSHFDNSGPATLKS